MYGFISADMEMKMNYWAAVVDDDAISLKYVNKMLTSKGMRVSCIRSGRYLLKFMENNTPDIILLDIQMPEINGFETYRMLRELEDEKGIKHTPVIFLSGEEDSEAEQRGLGMGAADYIRKPFDADSMLGRIHNAVNNSRIIDNLTEEAEHDKLTGFLNKTSGTKKAASLCETKIGALIMMDIDCFKLVNDLYGHDTGDKLLMIFSEALAANARSDDLICRVGGDEFMAFFVGINEEEAVASLADRVNTEFVRRSEEYIGEKLEFPLGISVGAAFAPIHSSEYKELFQYADQTLYKVKQNGKHGYEIYDPTEDYSDIEENLDREINRITQIAEERSTGKGAMLLGQDSFAWNYRYIIRFIKRYSGEVSMILFMLTPSANGTFTSESAAVFADILQRSLRMSDIILQNRPNQFFLLMPELSEVNVPGVAGRILSAWNANAFSENVNIRYFSKTLSYKDNNKE